MQYGKVLVPASDVAAAETTGDVRDDKIGDKNEESVRGTGTVLKEGGNPKDKRTADDAGRVEEIGMADDTVMEEDFGSLED